MLSFSFKVIERASDIESTEVLVTLIKLFDTLPTQLPYGAFEVGGGVGLELSFLQAITKAAMVKKAINCFMIKFTLRV